MSLFVIGGFIILVVTFFFAGNSMLMWFLELAGLKKRESEKVKPKHKAKKLDKVAEFKRAASKEGYSK
jgi:hypothetical protein